MDNRRGYTLLPSYPVDVFQTPLGSFDELHIERTYLLKMLQRQDLRATELLKHIRTLEDDLNNSPKGRIAKKLRTQIGWLKKRMIECTQQEKFILERLGYVTYEIQSVERFHRIENERLYHMACCGNQEMQPSAACSASVSQPGYFGHWSPQEELNDSYCGAFHQQLLMFELTPAWPAPPSAPVTTIGTESNQSPYIIRGPGASRARAASADNLSPLVEKAKRLSMPDMPTGKAEEDESASDSVKVGDCHIGQPAH